MRGPAVGDPSCYWSQAAADATAATFTQIPWSSTLTSITLMSVRSTATPTPTATANSLRSGVTGDEAWAGQALLAGRPVRP